MTPDKYGDAQDFYLTPGDTMNLEYSVSLDGGSAEQIGTFTIEASAKCLVVYTPVHPERFKMMRHQTLEFYRHAVLHAAELNGGQLNTQEIESVFKKKEFENKLRYGTE